MTKYSNKSIDIKKRITIRLSVLCEWKIDLEWTDGRVLE